MLPVLGLLFCLNGLLFSIKTPQGMMVIAAGHYKETKIQTTIQASILVVGGLIFTGVFAWGLYGVVLAAILSNLYRAVDFVIYIENHIVKGSLRQTLFNICSCFIVVAVVFLFFPYVQFGEANAVAWILNAIVVGIISVLIVLFMSLLFQRKNLIGAIKRVKSIFIRT